MSNGPQIVPATAPDVAERAARVLRGGGLVVIPTDTVYGLAAALGQPCALEAIYQAKRRSHDMPLPVLVASPADADRMAAEPLTAGARRLCERFWPGALTVIVPAATVVPAIVTSGTGTVGLRMPDSEVALAIIAAAGGALAVTSANISGDDAASDVSALPAELLAHVALVVDGGPCPGGVPSTVVDLTGPQLRLVREGAISAAAVRAALTDTDEGPAA